MKRVSFFVRNAALPPPPTERRLEVYDTSVIRDRLNRSMRRRLSDDMEVLIRKASMLGRHAVAEDMLAVLTKLLDAETKQFQRDRRITEGVIEGLAAEIAASRARKIAA